jgi:hypothetical protein
MRRSHTRPDGAQIAVWAGLRVAGFRTRSFGPRLATLAPCRRLPPRRFGVTKRFEHELTPDLRRTYDEPSVARTNPPWDALASTIDADLIAYLR